MAEHGDHDELDEATGYKPPEKKALDVILKQDVEDESLQKYKQTLIGDGAAVVFTEDPRFVIVQKLALLVDERPDLELDLSGGKLSELKKKSFTLKEACHYRVRIYFYVQREIVTGLKYVQKSYRKGIQVDKTNYMVGSYGPKMELQSYTTPVEEAPSGMLARGSYTIKSLFTDDDKHEHLKWEWTLEIKKDWQ